MANVQINETISPRDIKTAKAGCKRRRFSELAIKELNELLTHYPDQKSAMLPALWIAQREYGGHLTREALQEVAELLGQPRMDVEAVASFYSMYNFEPRGKHHLEVCTCLTCGCVGAYDVLNTLEKRLNVHIGETTTDGEFTLSEVECLDWCEAGTVIQVGNKYYGNVTADNVDVLIDDLMKSNEHTPVGLADDIVKVMLPVVEKK